MGGRFFQSIQAAFQLEDGLLEICNNTVKVLIFYLQVRDSGEKFILVTRPRRTRACALQQGEWK